MSDPNKSTAGHNHYLRNRDKILKKHREYYRANREAILQHQRVYRHTQRDRLRVYGREYAKRRWKKAIDYLGDKCVRCGFNDERAFQIDHIRGGGLEERRQLGSSAAIYRRVLTNPEDYQLLCANCNRIKCVEEGEVPYA